METYENTNRFSQCVEIPYPVVIAELLTPEKLHFDLEDRQNLRERKTCFSLEAVVN